MNVTAFAQHLDDEAEVRESMARDMLAKTAGNGDMADAIAVAIKAAEASTLRAVALAARAVE